MELLSHPKKLLTDHLTGVAKRAMEIYRGKNINFSLDFDGENIDVSPFIKDLVYFSAVFHDIGKATSFFQNYIRNPHKEFDARKNHALISAFFVYYLSGLYFENKQINTNLAIFLKIFAFLAVKNHHSGISNDLENELSIETRFLNYLSEQADSVDAVQIQKIIDDFLTEYDFEISWSGFKDFIKNKEYEAEFDDFFTSDFMLLEYDDINPKTQITLFYIHQFLYSTLLFGDKNEVILNKKNLSIEQSDVVGKVLDFRDIKGFDNPVTDINKLKNEAFFSSEKRLEQIFDKQQHIYSLTLPTGFGKTITALYLADKIRKLTQFKEAKIIINIPFTSIIDQNFGVFEEILGTNNTSILLKHHHLAETSYKDREETLNYDKSQFLIETWQSDIVVTTFVQFLETLLNRDKNKLMKFSHLANSVILLDEIQTVDYELWPTIRETFKVLGEKFNIYFVLMSATQPLIFTPDDDIVEIVPDYKKYFRVFNRTVLNIKIQKSIEISEFKDDLLNYIQENEKDILVILNTKKLARDVFIDVRENLNLDDYELYFLTTLITPFERKRIINKIKNSTGKQKIIVSTQLVEAGVDISVDTVFRQLAPLDSIIQAAGRANRYNEKDSISEVFVYNINDKGSKSVYGGQLIFKTKNVLEKYTKIEEKDYINIIEDYFKEVKQQAENTSQGILKAIKGLNFKGVDLKLIEERETESVFVQLNEEAKQIWEKYEEIYAADNLKPWDKKRRFSEIKSKFYDFVINVPIPNNKGYIAFDSEKICGFYVSDFDEPSQNYSYSEVDFSQNTGYDNGVVTETVWI